LSALPLSLVYPCLLLVVTALTWGNGVYIHAKALFAQLLIADAWEKALIADDSSTGIKPWPWADTWPVARIRSSYLSHDLYVLAGAQGSSLAFGPGHVDGTALPGNPGTTVIAGHRDTHFNFLQQLNPGDTLEIQSRNGAWKKYLVLTVEIIDTRLTETHRINPALDELLLMTCFPFDAIDPGGPLRMVVTLSRVDRG